MLHPHDLYRTELFQMYEFHQAADCENHLTISCVLSFSTITGIYQGEQYCVDQMTVLTWGLPNFVDLLQRAIDALKQRLLLGGMTVQR